MVIVERHSKLPVQLDIQILRGRKTTGKVSPPGSVAHLTQSWRGDPF